MLKKASGKISRIFSYAVLIMLAAQILTGCAWGVLNFFTLQNFPDTAELVKLSGSLKLTGDTGIIYPALLIVVRTLTVNGPVLFYHVMYLIQIVLAFVSWFVFARNVFKFDSKLKDAFFALAVVTNPFAMQVHLAVLEYSFVSSFICLLISFQIRFVREWKSADKNPGLEKALRDLSVTSLFWLATALTRKEFILIGCIPVIVLLITIIRRLAETKGKKALAIISPVLLVLAFCGIISMTDSLFRTGEKLSFIDSAKRDMYYRVAWSENFRDRYRWPAYLASFVDEGMMTHIMNDPGLVRTEFTDYVTERLGSKETTDKYFEWAKASFAGNRKQIVTELISDMAGYVLVPVKTEYVLRGCEFPGYAAGNYDVMKQNAPKLTKVYLRYFSVAYIFMIVMCVVGACAEALSGKTKGAANAGDTKADGMIVKRGFGSIALVYLPAVLVVLCTCVRYAFYGCNVYDHRKVVFTTCLLIGTFACFALKVFEEKCCQE